MESLLLIIFFLCIFLFCSLLAVLYILYLVLQKSGIITSTGNDITPENAEDVRDSYTPEYGEQTVPLEQFTPKKGIKVKFVEDEEDQITPAE